MKIELIIKKKLNKFSQKTQTFSVNNNILIFKQKHQIHRDGNYLFGYFA